MGFFSWKFCNCKGRLIIGNPAYLLMPDGNHIYEFGYDGHGHFGAYDVYEVMAEQNQAYLEGRRDLEHFVEPPEDISNYSSQESYERAVRRYNYAVQRLRDFASGKDENYMEKKYDEDWLREIGIELDNCPSKYKRRLPFRIKVSSEPVDYKSVRPSAGDEKQGCY